jgi:hypothetical protein
LYRPYKYFSFQIPFTIAVASGQCFWILAKFRPKWLGYLGAIALIVAGVWFLYPKMTKIQRDTYTFEIPAEFLTPEEEFFNVQGKDLPRGRTHPFRAATYLNLLRNVGTIDWYTGIPIEENAVPKYFVDSNNNYIPNSEYQGETFFLAITTEQPLQNPIEKVALRPNSIEVFINVQTPGTLVINQNYHRDWHTNEGKLFSMGGLIALRLSKTGNYTISLKYISRSFYGGLVISILSISALGVVCWAYLTGRLISWSKSDSLFLKRGSQAILWLIEV